MRFGAREKEGSIGPTQGCAASVEWGTTATDVHKTGATSARAAPRVGESALACAASCMSPVAGRDTPVLTCLVFASLVPLGPAAASSVAASSPSVSPPAGLAVAISAAAQFSVGSTVPSAFLSCVACASVFSSASPSDWPWPCSRLVLALACLPASS